MNGRWRRGSSCIHRQLSHRATELKLPVLARSIMRCPYHTTRHHDGFQKHANSDFTNSTGIFVCHVLRIIKST